MVSQCLENNYGAISFHFLIDYERFSSNNNLKFCPFFTHKMVEPFSLYFSCLLRYLSLSCCVVCWLCECVCVQCPDTYAEGNSRQATRCWVVAGVGQCWGKWSREQRTGSVRDMESSCYWSRCEVCPAPSSSAFTHTWALFGEFSPTTPPSSTLRPHSPFVRV